MRGQLGERAQMRSVYKHIRKHDAAGQAETIGYDYAVLSGNAGEPEIISACGTAHNPELAWHMAMNHFAASGAKARGVRVSLYLSTKVTEAEVKPVMQKLNAKADAEQIQIMSASTCILDTTEQILCEVTAIGTRLSGPDNFSYKKICVGDEVVQIGYTAKLATHLIYTVHADELAHRYNRAYVQRALELTSNIDVRPYVTAVIETGIPIRAIKTQGHGGPFAALKQLGHATNKGLTITPTAIPILQETIEATEYFNLNPYTTHSEGATLIITPKGHDLATTLRQQGIPATPIATLTQEKACVLTSTNQTLPLTETDDLYKLPKVTI